MILLYDKDECPFCWRVRMSLTRAGVAFERRPFDAPEWRAVWPALTPSGTVPVMIDGELCITESANALSYIDENYGGILPAEPARRAQAREVMAYADSILGPAARDYIFECREHPAGERNEALLQDAVGRWRSALPGLAERLGTQAWFLGECSQADYVVATRLGLAFSYGLPLEGTPAPLMAWAKRVFARAEVLDTAPRTVATWLASNPFQVAGDD